MAGGFDDLTLEAIIGFGDMAATANTEMMRAKGISDAGSPVPTIVDVSGSSKHRAAARSCWPAATWP